MQHYIKALRDYCKHKPLNHGDAEFVMEFLYWHYAEFNPVDNQKMRNNFTQIRQQYPHLSMQEFDPIFTTVSDLCVEHERLAFYEGLRLGAAFMLELAEGKTVCASQKEIVEA